MFGLKNLSILLAYLFSIGGALLCVLYGIIRWNKDNGAENDGGDGK